MIFGREDLWRRRRRGFEEVAWHTWSGNDLPRKSCYECVMAVDIRAL